MNIVLYGPPGAGKTTVGLSLARRLRRRFVDTDQLIEARTGLSCKDIFAKQGEAAFRALERETIANVAAQDNLVISPGGGALVDDGNRRALQATGVIVALMADPETLLARLGKAATRPLLAGADTQTRLSSLLGERAALYTSFFAQVDTHNRHQEQVAAAIAELLTPLERTLHDTTIEIGPGSRHQLDAWLPDTPRVVVSDDVVAPLWAETVATQLDAPLVTVPSGEAHKTLATIGTLYEAFLQHGLDRSGMVVAVGGGVVGDMAGFAAASFMRGVRWANLPTTLLAMVDASLGGKTGVDLPQGKNLVGAFHHPSLVVADPVVLETLPDAELRAGLAEAIKHGVIADPDLFANIGRRPTRAQLAQAMQVKIDIVAEDARERGVRARLNLGHTIGHGIEAASHFALRHGECVAIGMVGEAMLAERLGLADATLVTTIRQRLTDVGLPTYYEAIDPQEVRAMMANDKKKRAGRLRFALPVAIGAVRHDVIANDDVVMGVLHDLRK